MAGTENTQFPDQPGSAREKPQGARKTGREFVMEKEEDLKSACGLVLLSILAVLGGGYVLGSLVLETCAWSRSSQGFVDCVSWLKGAALIALAVNALFVIALCDGGRNKECP